MPCPRILEALQGMATLTLELNCHPFSLLASSWQGVPFCKAQSLPFCRAKKRLTSLPCCKAKNSLQGILGPLSASWTTVCGCCTPCCLQVWQPSSQGLCFFSFSKVAESVLQEQQPFCKAFFSPFAGPYFSPFAGLIGPFVRPTTLLAELHWGRHHLCLLLESQYQKPNLSRKLSFQGLPHM